MPGGQLTAPSVDRSRGTQGRDAALIELVSPFRIQYAGALQQRKGIAREAMSGPEVLNGLAIQILRPASLRRSGRRSSLPELLDVLQEQVAPPLLSGRLPQMPGREHGPGAAHSASLVGLGMLALTETWSWSATAVIASTARARADADLAKEIGRDDAPVSGSARYAAVTRSMAIVGSRVSRPPLRAGGTTAPTAPPRSRGTGLEPGSWRVAFIVERMQRPVVVGAARPLSVTNDRLDYFSRSGFIPCSTEEWLMTIKFEEHETAFDGCLRGPL